MITKALHAEIERALSAADQIRAERRSAPQHFSSADLDLRLRPQTMTYEAKLGSLRAMGASKEGFVDAVRDLADQLGAQTAGLPD